MLIYVVTVVSLLDFIGNIFRSRILFSTDTVSHLHHVWNVAWGQLKVFLYGTMQRNQFFFDKQIGMVPINPSNITFVPQNNTCVLCLYATVSDSTQVKILTDCVVTMAVITAHKVLWAMHYLKCMENMEHKNARNVEFTSR